MGRHEVTAGRDQIEQAVALEVVQGESRNRAAAEQLSTVLGQAVDKGVLYLGYPVLTTADDRVDIDALLVTREHGLVALLLSDDLPARPRTGTRWSPNRTAYMRFWRAT